MRKRVGLVIFLALLLGLTAAPMATAAEVKLNAPDYAWWYGCTATSAGMMMGYYDRNGYGGLLYDNLVPGGVAELSNFGNPGALANNAIASPGHISAFYRAGYGASGDDIPANHPVFDSLADFMGTSQDSVPNVNGGTSIYYFTNGAKFTATDALNFGVGVWSKDGMYGMWEYFTYAGYNNSRGNFFTQLTDNQGQQYGFSFADFQAEINAGRVLLVHVTNHTMLGYGYDDQGNIFVHDTWALGGGSMPWGGSYSGLDLWGVTCMTPTGGVVPLPPSVILLGSGLLGVLWGRKRFTQR
jgi:hypothetical protein